MAFDGWVIYFALCFVKIMYLLYLIRNNNVTLCKL